MVRDTSLAAYIGITADGTAATKRAIVYRQILRQPGTRNEIAKATGLPINTVCGRVRELLDVGAVFEFGQATCSVTGKTACLLVAADRSLSEPAHPTKRMTRLESEVHDLIRLVDARMSWREIMKQVDVLRRVSKYE